MICLLLFIAAVVSAGGLYSWHLQNERKKRLEDFRKRAGKEKEPLDKDYNAESPFHVPKETHAQSSEFESPAKSETASPNEGPRIRSLVSGPRRNRRATLASENQSVLG